MSRRWGTVPADPEAHRPPVVGAELWAAVMAAAGYRCQCAGECGRSHRKDPGGRCEHGDIPARRLAAVPADPVTTTEAAGLPPASLLAFCSPCHTGRVRAARRAGTDVEPAQVLF